MKPEDISIDSIGLVLSIDDDEIVSISTVSNLSESMPEDSANVLIDAANGLNAILTSGLEMVCTYGATLRALQEEIELNEGSVVFEAHEELDKAISENRVIQFDKNRLN